MQRHLLSTRENNKTERGIGSYDVFKIDIDVSNRDRYHLWNIETNGMDITMIEILQEITDWGEDKVSNHIYYVRNKTSLIAYIPEGSKKKIEFTKPLSFSKSRRRFKTL
tara:strand:+ start:462 stop:788 length:327 start_codon:yes stop_codon:yes gene_type:complete